ncbi:hypothetical protein [Aeromonas bivalvium]|uniref:hypothetical protein n=1 Tax=Aeromonas bivalvium TaxID=440079 RepID=UPI0009FE4BCC|nr:hypothetical protein [Aeromonas bivalvium]
MGRVNTRVWILLLGWLWLQPALAQHPLEAELAGHNHHCLVCALHLDGKLAIPPTPFLLAAPGIHAEAILSCRESAALAATLTQPIRAPPSSLLP